jgi:hypothetical protein
VRQKLVQMAQKSAHQGANPSGQPANAQAGTHEGALRQGLVGPGQGLHEGALVDPGQGPTDQGALEGAHPMSSFVGLMQRAMGGVLKGCDRLINN